MRLKMNNLNVGVVADVDHIKYKVIQLYYKLLKRLYKGYQDDYSTVMNMINFISLPRDPEQDRKIYEYLINIRP